MIIGKLSLFLAAALASTSVLAQTYTLDIDLKKPGAPIQETMYGIFFEDINYAADGGLYAELVKNRSFEFPADPLQEVPVTLPEDPEGDYVWASDEFSSGPLALVWQWNHKDPGDWSLTERPGFLRLRAHPADSLPQALGTLTQRTVGPRCISEVRLDPSGLETGSEAGICAFQSRSARIGVEVAADGSRAIVAREREREVYRSPLASDGPLWLRIRYVFTPGDASDRADTAFLGYSLDGKQWTELDYMLEMQYTLDYFTGYRSALYCMGPSGFADFDYFHQWVY